MKSPASLVLVFAVGTRQLNPAVGTARLQCRAARRARRRDTQGVPVPALPLTFRCPSAPTDKQDSIDYSKLKVPSETARCNPSRTLSLRSLPSVAASLRCGLAHHSCVCDAGLLAQRACSFGPLPKSCSLLCFAEVRLQLPLRLCRSLRRRQGQRVVGGACCADHAALRTLTRLPCRPQKENAQSGHALSEPAVFFDLLALPRSLALDILARLPVDTRLRCIEVNRAWRALLADTSLWLCLDISRHGWFGSRGGVERFSVLLFHAAVAKAGGQLRSLNIQGHLVNEDIQSDLNLLPFSVLYSVVVANATTLVELRLLSLEFNELRMLCQSAPALTRLESDAYCDSLDKVYTLLLKQEPFSCLKLMTLIVLKTPELINDSAVSSFAQQLVDHGHTLTGLMLSEAPLNTAAAMGAIADAARTLHLSKLKLDRCRATPATVPALTRLVAAGRLDTLVISNGGVVLFEEGADTTRLFCDAVRDSSLIICDLNGVGQVQELAELAASMPIKVRIA